MSRVGNAHPTTLLVLSPLALNRRGVGGICDSDSEPALALGTLRERERLRPTSVSGTLFVAGRARVRVIRYRYNRTEYHDIHLRSLFCTVRAANAKTLKLATLS